MRALGPETILRRVIKTALFAMDVRRGQLPPSQNPQNGRRPLFWHQKQGEALRRFSRSTRMLGLARLATHKEIEGNAAEITSWTPNLLADAAQPRVN